MSKGLARNVLYRDGKLEVAGERRSILGLVAYHFPAVTASSGSAFGEIVGPTGARGRIIDATSTVTTNVTVAADVVQFGDGTDADEYGTHTVAVAAAGATVQSIVAGDDEVTDVNGRVVVTNTGASTAGVYDLTVYIEWYYPEL